MNVNIDNCNVLLKLGFPTFFQKNLPEIETYIEQHRYDPKDPFQKKLIDHHLTLLDLLFKKLSDTDKKVGVALSAESVLWFFGIINAPISLLLTLGIFLYATQYELRPHLSKQFQIQLEKLIQLYQWCGKEYGPKITHDETFLKLLKAIAPYTPSHQLLLWQKPIAAKARDFSQSFVDILATPPHNLKLLIVTPPHSIIKKIKTVFTKNPYTSFENTSSTCTSSFFQKNLAEVKLSLYGYEPLSKLNTAQTTSFPSK